MSLNDNDLLGTKAENLLDLKCNEVGLKTIDPKPDIEGVDRRIVWVRPGSMDLADGESHDTVKPYRSVSVQIKATESREGVVKVKLSAAKHMVDTSEPAFILIVKYNSNDHPTFSFLHVKEAVIKRILQALRKCQEKNKLPHKTNITFRMSAGAPVDAQDIKTYLEKEIGEDMGEYAKTKIDFRASCGYEANRHTMNGILRADDVSSMIDGLMGRKPLQIVEAEHFETRFNITLPGKSPFNGDDLRITLSPLAVGDWTVTVKGTETVSMKGSVTTNYVPGMPDNIREIEWDTGLCKLVMTEGRFDFSLDVEDALNKPHLPSVLINNISFVQIFFDGAALNIYSEAGNQLFSLPTLDLVHPNKSFDVDYWMSLLRGVEYIWQKAGMEEYPVTLNELDISKIYSGSVLLNPVYAETAKSGHCKITRAYDEMDEIIVKADTLGYAISMVIGEKRIGICSIFEAVITTEGTEFVLKTTKLSKSSARLLRKGREEEDFEIFFEDQRLNFKPSVWLISFSSDYVVTSPESIQN